MNMMRNEYPLSEYQADRDAGNVQASAQVAATILSQTPTTATLLEIIETAQAAGLVLVQKRGRFAIVRTPPPGWSKVWAIQKNLTARPAPCAA